MAGHTKLDKLRPDNIPNLPKHARSIHSQLLRFRNYHPQSNQDCFSIVSKGWYGIFAVYVPWQFALPHSRIPRLTVWPHTPLSTWQVIESLVVKLSPCQNSHNWVGLTFLSLLFIVFMEYVWHKEITLVTQDLIRIHSQEITQKNASTPLHAERLENSTASGYHFVQATRSSKALPFVHSILMAWWVSGQFFLKGPWLMEVGAILFLG